MVEHAHACPQGQPVAARCQRSHGAVVGYPGLNRKSGLVEIYRRRSGAERVLGRSPANRPTGRPVRVGVISRGACSAKNRLRRLPSAFILRNDPAAPATSLLTPRASPCKYYMSLQACSGIQLDSLSGVQKRLGIG